MVEHPEPPVRPPDPHPSLVRSQDRAGEKPRLDQARLGRKRRPAGVEDIDQRAFADVEPEQVPQHAAQSCQRDALDRTQIDHEGAQVRPERRSRFQPDWRRGLEAFRAARADPAMQRHPRHVRPARRDLDAVVTLADALRGAGDVGTAAPTRRCEHVARRGGVGMKRPMRAGMRVGLRLCGGWTGRLLPLRGRRARIVGRLRRKPQRRLKLGDPHRQLRVLLHQRLDPRHQRGDQSILVRRVRWKRHAQVDSYPGAPRNPEINASPRALSPSRNHLSNHHETTQRGMR
jgi:hypothetical protein